MTDTRTRSIARRGIYSRAVIAAFGAMLFATVARPARADGRDKPNVILIMADDLGAEVLGSYGSAMYTTPNLDRLADEGARFDNAYAMPLCTPSRVMLMTGQYPNRTGFTDLIAKRKTARMPASLKTFANYFKEAGYATAVAGKWQLGQLDQFSNQPKEHGFDEYCLWDWMHDNHKSSRYYKPSIRTNGERFLGGKADYGPDIYLRFVLEFIDKHRDEPFLVYFPMTLPHRPFVRPPRLREAARTKYPPGVDPETAKFGHMVTYLDEMVGRIVQKVAEAGIEEQTLIIFTGDNGSPSEVRSRLGNLTIQGGKGAKSEAGTRVPFIARRPGHIPPGVRSQLISLVDVLPTLTGAAGIPAAKNLDGMDLSHVLDGKPGPERDHLFFAFKEDLWIRDREYRYHKDGTLGYCPVTSDKKRYGFNMKKTPAYTAAKARLKKVLQTYEQILPPENAEESVRGKKKHPKKQRRRKQADSDAAASSPRVPSAE